MHPCMNGRKLLAKLLEKNTQADLADLAGVSQETISRLAAGEVKPSIATALALQKKLAIPVESWGQP